MAVRGIFNSHSGIVGERPNDVSSRLLRIGYLGTAPLTALSRGMPAEKTDQTSFSWIDSMRTAGNQTATATATANATTIVIDDAGIWPTNATIICEATGEHILVTAIAADGQTLTVVRGLGGTTKASIAISDTFQLIGNAFAEGTGKPDPITEQGSEYFNNVQITKTGWAITGTAKHVKHTSGSKMAQNKQQCLAYHADSLERTAIWGVRHSQSLNKNRLYTTGGIVSHIEKYGGLVESAAYGGNAGEMSLGGLEEFFRKIHDKKVMDGANERLVFTGSKTLQNINRMVRMDSNYDIRVMESRYGVKVTEILGFNYNVKFLTHPMMVENATWQQEMYVIHPGLIKRKVLRPTIDQEFLIDKNTNAGVDADEGFLQDEFGWEVRGAPVMGIMRNIQTPVAT